MGELLDGARWKLRGAELAGEMLPESVSLEALGENYRNERSRTKARDVRVGRRRVMGKRRIWPARVNLDASRTGQLQLTAVLLMSDS